MQRRGHPDGHRGTNADAGFSMIATAISLLATAVLVALLLGATLHSNGTTATTGVANAPGVAQADDYVAQQALTTALSSSDAALTGGGGGVSGLSAVDPSISFTPGPSTNATTISVAQASGVDGGTGVDGVGLAGAGVGGNSGGGGGGTSGALTLADRSADGTCWLVWRSAGSATYYGAQTGRSGCTAPAIGAAPSPGPVSSSAIGWQAGSFPSP